MRRTGFFLMGVLNLLCAIGLPSLTTALIGISRTVSMSTFSDLVHAGVIVIDEQKAKSYRNAQLNGDWGDVSLYTTVPFLELSTAGYTAAGILLVNTFAFFILWWRGCNAADADRAHKQQVATN